MRVGERSKVSKTIVFSMLLGSWAGSGQGPQMRRPGGGRPKHLVYLSNCLRPSRHRAHTCEKWPAGLGDNSVLCLEFRHQKIFKNKTECWPFFGFFFDALWHLGCRKSLEICSTSSQKSVKREAWGGSGGSGWSPWRHLGPKMAQSSEKHAKRRITTYPPGDQWGTKI